MHHSLVTTVTTSPALTDVTAATTDTVIITHPILRVNAAAGAITTYTLPNGVPGQMLKIIMESADDVDIVPTTSIEFSNIDLDDIGDSATLFYVDDTVGWIIISLVGAADAVTFTAA